MLLESYAINEIDPSKQSLSGSSRRLKSNFVSVVSLSPLDKVFGAVFRKLIQIAEITASLLPHDAIKLSWFGC